MGEGKEGDWECCGCRNRNYAFRSFCNRCKQSRLLVDAKTPVDSKWLPRIGDWICTGCSNNNYASREKCKKCGQTKDEAAMPAISVPGISLANYSHYFARQRGVYGSHINFALSDNPAVQSLAPISTWLFRENDNFGMQSAPSSSFTQNGRNYSFSSNASPFLLVPKGWRNGDWLCDCGFHNYSSRLECKKCSAPLASSAPSVATSTVSDVFSTIGTKRLASEDLAISWDSKRLNGGDISNYFLTNGNRKSNQTFEESAKYSFDPVTGEYAKYPNDNFATASIQVNMHSLQQKPIPTLVGKGAKQWRDGDWMCNNCNNHNFASRSICNRCKTQKEAALLPNYVGNFGMSCSS